MLLYIAGWLMVVMGPFGFMIATTALGQIIAALVHATGWVCIGAAAIIGKLEEINGRLDRHAVRSWNVSVATLDQIKSPNETHTPPDPRSAEFRQPLKPLPSWENPARPQTTPTPPLS